MIRMPANLAAAAALATCLLSPVSAAPVVAPLALKNAAPAAVETVQWRRGRGWGGAAAGFAAGAIIGGAIAGAPYYGGPYGYPAYPPPPPAYGYYEGGDDAVAYCMHRFRSYDPASGTYMGYDGLRHPCP